MRDLQIEDHRVRIELAADDEEVADVLRQLVAAGIEVRSFAEKDPTLEDVFMMVTKGLVI
jgi:ABC-2 type transport system ATP-binding protein